MTDEINSDPGHLAATLAGAIVNLLCYLILHCAPYDSPRRPRL
jgi:hypothetical protein